MNLMQYIKKYKSIWIIVLLFNLMCHGTMLMSNSIGIDTEDMITLKSLFYGEWLSMGRQGLVFLKKLLGTYWFEPYFAGAATIMMLTLACILWTYYICKIIKKENGLAILFFCTIFSASAILTEQLYFKLQAFEISAAFGMTAVNLLLLFETLKKETAKKNKILPYAIVIASNVILFSVYQVMVALFIFGTAAGFFLEYFFVQEENWMGKAVYWKRIIISILIFLISFCLNQVITKMFFSSGAGYLQNQMSWFTQSLKDCLINIYWHVRDAELGRSLHYSGLLVIFSIMLFVYGMICFKRDKDGKIPAFFSLGFVLAGPFYMTLLLGKMPVIRSQLVMPITLAFMGYCIIVLGHKNKWMKYVAIALCLILTYSQMQNTMRLNYTDQVRYENDVRMAAQISEQLNELEDEIHSYPVVFIGRHAAQLNNSCTVGDAIGFSIFDWDTYAEPIGFCSTRRIVGFLHTLGANYMQANLAQTAVARVDSQNMPCWPAKGSIELRNGVIIVKLSD